MSNDDVLAAQIKSSIITKIKTQEYLPGELLPSERDFATMYSVSRYFVILQCCIKPISFYLYHCFFHPF